MIASVSKVSGVRKEVINLISPALIKTLSSIDEEQNTYMELSQRKNVPTARGNLL